MANKRARQKIRAQKRQEQRDRLRKAQLDYAASMADPKASFQPTTSSTLTRSNIESYLKSPYSNAESIATAMRTMVNNNGTIKRVIDYYVSQPTYNHNIFPSLGTNKQYDYDASTGMEDYIDVANQLELLDVKYFAPFFVRETLISGISYFYEVSDKKGSAYIEFPYGWCKIYGMDSGCYRFMLDMSKIKDDVALMLPAEIQTAQQTYASQGVSTDDPNWYDNKWYKFGDKGVAFCFDQNVIMNGGIAISEFASLLLDSNDLESAKKNVQIKDNIDTVRLIHSKIPVDTDGKPTIPLEVAKIYDTQMTKRLPTGVVSITSPNNLDNVSLNGSGNSKSYDTVESALGQVFYNFGVPSALFGSDTTSSNIAKLSIQISTNYIYTYVLPALTNYYNYKLSKVKTKAKLKWSIRFFRQSNFTLKDDLAAIKDQITMGGSRTDLLTASGASPAEVYSHLLFEQQVMAIDDVMVVKATSHTVSGTDDNANAGRPKTDNPTDDTDRIDGSQ